MNNRQFSFNWKILVLLSLLFVSSCAIHIKENTGYISHKVENDVLIIESHFKKIQLRAYKGDAIEVFYRQQGDKQLSSYAKKDNLPTLHATIENTPTSIRFKNGQLLAVINKLDLSIDFYRGDELLTRQSRYFISEQKRGFDFELDLNEKILGGGQRVLGMDRRGHRMPLYNRAHYGYTTESNQMNFSMPMVMSSKKYSILFDNTAKGNLDIGSTDKNTLSFEAVSGRTAYIVFAANNYPQLISNYVAVTGTQPMPPRWAFGHFLSRFGYRTEQQVRETVNKTFAEDLPADAVILDLYWFGPDIKGHVGNLAWDKNAFPTHQNMIDDLKNKGINTILITEPFILSNSLKWQEAEDNQSLIKNTDGSPYKFDFYFGNTGLIDVFDDNAIEWFSTIYRDIFAQGIAGSWGDLGEPEVHPDDSLHYVSDIQRTARADEVHNAYGHQWAKLVYEKQLELQPNNRPFIMMRSGFAGSQRYAMIPWTGDVARSWGGLKPQVELSLQMGLFGMSYTHSDLGGFADAGIFDKEMYIRWLQYGVFQPIYRPHAQDLKNNPPEIAYQDQQTKDILRGYVKLRYRLLPYIYTTAYQNSTTGMPLMRPLFFENEADKSLIDIKDSYLWGDSFFVSPVTNAETVSQAVQLPKGIWFDYWNDQRFQGGATVDIPVTLETIPVLVRAGAFVPMIDDIKNTREYSSKNLTLHYYADKSVQQSNGYMYEDDGSSFDSIGKKEYEILNFEAKQSDNHLLITFSRTTKGYQGMPNNRQLTIELHNWMTSPSVISFGDKKISFDQYQYNEETRKLSILVPWDHQTTQLSIH